MKKKDFPIIVLSIILTIFLLTMIPSAPFINLVQQEEYVNVASADCAIYCSFKTKWYFDKTRDFKNVSFNNDNTPFFVATVLNDNKFSKEFFTFNTNGTKKVLRTIAEDDSGQFVYNKIFFDKTNNPYFYSTFPEDNRYFNVTYLNSNKELELYNKDGITVRKIIKFKDNDYLFVSTKGLLASKLLIYNSNFKISKELGFPKTPNDFDVDEQGNIYAIYSDFENKLNTVEIYDQKKNYAKSTLILDQSFIFTNPKLIAFKNVANQVIIYQERQAVLLNKDRKFIELEFPAVRELYSYENSDNGQIYVETGGQANGNYFSGRTIYRVNQSGKFVPIFATPVIENNPMSEGKGIFFDRSENMYLKGSFTNAKGEFVSNISKIRK